MIATLEWLNRMPLPIQHACGAAVRMLPAGITHGRTFNTTMDLLRRTERYDTETIERFQISALRSLLIHAGETVPYYRSLFRGLHFDPIKFRSLQDIEALPLLEKERMRQDPQEFRSERIPETAARYVTTGGSTGEPFGFWIDRTASLVEWAFMVRQWKRMGYRPLDRRAIIRGITVGETASGRTWEFRPLRNEVILSSFHMTRERLYEYVSVIARFRPPFLHAYPSSATVLAQFIKESNIRLPYRLKGILAGSETVYPQQRRLVEEVFGCRMFTWYGMSEKVLLGGECEHDTAYHMFPEYGYLEVVDRSGQPIREDGGTGEIVGTGFLNRAMPMIRYRTGDIGKLRLRPCRCGRSYPLIERIEGRLQEMLVGKDGNLISFTALNMHSDVFDRVRQYQFYQDKRGFVELCIVPLAGYSASDEARILKALIEKTGDQIEYRVRVMDAIPLTPRGKAKVIDQQLKLDFARI